MKNNRYRVILGSSVLAILVGAKELRKFLSCVANDECKVQVRRWDAWKDTKIKLGIKTSGRAI